MSEEIKQGFVDALGVLGMLGECVTVRWSGIEANGAIAEAAPVAPGEVITQRAQVRGLRLMVLSGAWSVMPGVNDKVFIVETGLTHVITRAPVAGVRRALSAYDLGPGFRA